MAERRMFAKTIIDSDAFVDMPLSTQALYFHLSMRADDDGFINNPKKIKRMIGASDDDLKMLILKKFIIPFETGIVVIKHWKIHNYIKNDRYKPTVYQEEKKMLIEKDNKAYSLEPYGTQSGSRTDPDRIQTVSEMDTQVRLGKDRLDKDRLDKDNIEEDNIYSGSGEPNPLDGHMNPPVVPPRGYPEEEEPKKKKPVKHKYGEYNNVLLTDEELDKLKTKFPDWENRIENLSLYIESKGARYKSHYATILSWARREYPKEEKTAGRGQYGAQRGNVKTGSAEELDNFYKMIEEWAKEDTEKQ